MATKRLLDQDPEYEPIPVEIQEKRMKFIERDARNATVKKIESILKSQFAPEINNKAKEVNMVDDLLYEARQMIDRLRAQAVMKYFCEAGSKDTKPEENVIPSIHPTVKENLMGKAPKFTGVSSESPVVKNEVIDPPTSVLSSVLQNSTSADSSDAVNSKVPAIKEEEIPSRVPRMKTKCRVIVGNVSKFLPAAQRDEEDQSTHKWMVYVRGDKDSPNIDGFVKKVCFLLHSSYRPNDIVEICNPPFRLVKRGWGEFIIRVQLHFKDPRNKPVDIFHHLKLDKTYTGLQTLGAETVAELTLYKPESKMVPKPFAAIQPSPGPSHIHQTVPANVVNQVTTPVHDVTSAHNETIKSGPSLMSTIIAADKIKEEKDESCSSISSPAIASISKSPNSPIKNMATAKSHLVIQSPVKAVPGPFGDKAKSLVTIPKQILQPKPIRTVTQATKNQITNGVGTFIKCTDSQGRILLVPQTSLICMSSVNNNAVVKPFTMTQTVVQPPCGSNADLGKSLIQGGPPPAVSSNAKLPSYVLKVIPTVQSRPNQVLLIPVSEGSQKTQQTTSSTQVITNNASASGPSYHQSSINAAIASVQAPVKKTRNLLHWEQVLEGVRIQSSSNFMELLKKMMKVFPLISQDYDPASIPYCAPSVEVFQSWNIGKQRAAEWQRAGMVRLGILKLLKTQKLCLKLEDVWSRRQIMVWCRKNGYTPPLREKLTTVPGDPLTTGPTLAEISTVSDVKSIVNILESQSSSVPEDKADEEDEDVDIMTVDILDESRKKQQLPISPTKDCVPPSSLSVYFIKESAAEIGVKLKPVQLEPSVFVPVIEEMIHAACKEFASDLVRASLNQGYHRMGGKLPPEEVTVRDVFGALQKNNTFDFLTNKHLGVLQETLDQS